MAERRLVHALQRLHRQEPMREEVRVDAVIAAARVARTAAPGHRGGTTLELDDAALLTIIDDLAAAGRLRRRGHHVRLADHQPRLDPELQERVDRLLAGLREMGAAPVRVEGLAARLGIPPPVLDGLRRSGALVRIAPGIEFPSDVWSELQDRLAGMARRGALSVGRVRDELGTTRRHAEAILAFRRAARHRDRRPVR